MSDFEGTIFVPPTTDMLREEIKQLEASPGVLRYLSRHDECIQELQQVTPLEVSSCVVDLQNTQKLQRQAPVVSATILGSILMGYLAITTKHVAKPKSGIARLSDPVITGIAVAAVAYDIKEFFNHDFDTLMSIGLTHSEYRNAARKLRDIRALDVRFLASRRSFQDAGDPFEIAKTTPVRELTVREFSALYLIYATTKDNGSTALPAWFISFMEGDEIALSPTGARKFDRVITSVKEVVDSQLGLPDLTTLVAIGAKIIKKGSVNFRAAASILGITF